MEPGRRDREQIPRLVPGSHILGGAAMEPGRRDREQTSANELTKEEAAAAMEPGRRDREQTSLVGDVYPEATMPQWSPVDVTGNRSPQLRDGSATSPTPQWSPVDVTGNSCSASAVEGLSMMPQWSPVDVTGNSTRGG